MHTEARSVAGLGTGAAHRRGVDSGHSRRSAGLPGSPEAGRWPLPEDTGSGGQRWSGRPAARGPGMGDGDDAEAYSGGGPPNSQNGK